MVRFNISLVFIIKLGKIVIVKEKNPSGNGGFFVFLYQSLVRTFKNHDYSFIPHHKF